MCRLYGCRATHPTEVGCELIEAQNSLVHQSVRDERGWENPHGWGIGVWRDGEVFCEKQVEPASSSELFRSKAAGIKAKTVLAHVRRATVGIPSLSNTHPFRDGDILAAHNGHIGRFDDVRPRMLEAMTPAQRDKIEGTTDTEHFFRLLMSLQERRPDTAFHELIDDAILQVIDWRDEIDPEAELALNFLWTHGPHLSGSRYKRTLWYVERDEAHVCEYCGAKHAEVPPGEDYRFIAVASERITGEDWQPIPDESVFTITDDLELEIAPL